MSTRIEQTLHGSDARYYAIYAHCDECDTSWGWRDDDRKTTNHADLKVEAAEHDMEVHGG